MILDPHTPSDGRTALVSHITAQIQGACGASVPSPQAVEELAKAVEHFLEEEAGVETVDSTYLSKLAAKALASLGEGEAARRLFLFGTGMVRPSEWVVTGDEMFWTLDLRQMTVRDGASLELLFFKGLQIVLDSIADIWDASRGCGTLGLRHVCAAASALLGEPADRRAVRELGEEIRDLCSGKLGQLRNARGWVSTPRVMNLDF